MDADRFRRLLEVNRAIMAELDPDEVLRLVLDVARDETGAQYAAIGVLDPDRQALERFVTAGIPEAAHAAIGDPPRGRGVLGVLITDPHPLRLDDVGAHARSYGFPAGHPPMRSFLGVPILVRGQAWGNLYLAEKRGAARFTETDEEIAGALADSAAIAIGNARLYRAERERRRELERANAVLETTTELSRALGGVTDVEHTLELVTKRSRALVGARAAELAVLDDGEFVIRAYAGPQAGARVGARIPVARSVASPVLETGRTQRFDEVPTGVFARDELGARTAIAAPLLFKGRALGVLVVFDRIDDDCPFSADDVRVLEAFATSAATAVATAQTATDEALRRAIEASEAERRRWARELHDETLQELAGLRVLLSGARRSGDLEQVREALDEAVEMLTMGVANLRALITDVRPASLDEIGPAAAIEALVQRVRTSSGLLVDLELDLAYERGDVASRLEAEIETTIYRLVQEALTNVVKHARAEHVRISVRERDGGVAVEVSDDGAGFDVGEPRAGFGLVGMRERLSVVHGSVRVQSVPGAGTTVQARIPVARQGDVVLTPVQSSR